MIFAETYLVLPIFVQFSAKFILTLMCLYIACSSGYRIFKLNKHGSHKISWKIMYSFFLAAAGELLLYSTTIALPPDFAVIAIAALAANMFLTRKQWMDNLPTIAVK